MSAVTLSKCIALSHYNRQHEVCILVFDGWLVTLASDLGGCPLTDKHSPVSLDSEAKFRGGTYRLCFSSVTLHMTVGATRHAVLSTRKVTSAQSVMDMTHRKLRDTPENDSRSGGMWRAAVTNVSSPTEHTGWLKIKWLARQNAISQQPIEIFWRKLKNLKVKDVLT